MPILEIIDSEGKLSTVELDPTRSLAIGRADKCDIVLSDRALSRRHAEVSADADGWTIRDCGSRNGTFLNGRRLTEPVRLRAGDRVTMARCSLSFDVASDSGERVVYSDQPISSGGTFILHSDDVSGELLDGPSSIEGERRARGRFRIIEEANLELGAHDPLDVLLPKVLDLVFRSVNPDRAALVLEKNGEMVRRLYRGDPQGEMAISRTVAKRVMTEKISVLITDSFDEAESLARRDVRSVIAVPLWNQGEVIGFIYVDSRLASGRFDSEDLRVMTMLANLATMKIENAILFSERLDQQRIEQEVKNAAKLQRQLLPVGSPRIAGYRFEGLNIPCYEVGGDYYDCVELRPQTHGVVLADVAGKGIPAAMLMVVLQATFHARTDRRTEPAELMGHLNEAITRSAPDNRFVSLVYIELDSSANRVRFINAGHAPAPLIVRASGKTESLPAEGLPLGILADANYEVREFRLDPGDFVFVCTDGVTDTVNGTGEMFGDEKLEALLESMVGSSPATVREAVEERLASHAGGAPQPDDLTLVILQREP